MGFFDFLGDGQTPGQDARDAARRASQMAYQNTSQAVNPYLDYGKSLMTRFGGQGQSALDDYANFLSRGVSDQQRSAYANQLLGNTDRSFAKGQSDLMAQIRAQGGNSPLDSSVGAGALSSLYGQRSQAYGQAGAQADEWARNMQTQNLLARYQSLLGAAGEGSSLGLQGAGLLGNAGNAYAGQLGSLAEQETQAKQQQQQAFFQGLAGLGQAAAPFFVHAPSMGGGGAPTPLPGRSTDADISGMMPTGPSQRPDYGGTSIDPYLSTMNADLPLQGYGAYQPRALSPVGRMNPANPYQLAGLNFPKTGMARYNMPGY